MRFTDGHWHHRCGYSIHSATAMYEAQIGENSVSAFVLDHPIDEPNDLLSGVTLQYTFSSPMEDVIRVQIEHFAAAEAESPKFELNEGAPQVEVRDLEDKIILRSGKCRVEILKTKTFAYFFYYEDRLLTGSDEGGAAYIADVDYEAKRIADFNHRPMLKPYMDETYLRERLYLDVGEYVYGLGEHFMPLVRNGQQIDIWNRDGGSDSEQAYKNIPFYLSSRGYGVLVNTPDHIDYEIGTESVRHVQFSVEDERLEYLVIGASEPKEVLGRYTALSGRSPVPPAWTFGLWLSTSWLTEMGADEVLGVIDRMAESGIPLSVYHFDARWMQDFHDCDFVWHKRYGDPRDMLRRIHERGVRVCVWINPYVARPSRLFKEGVEGGYFLKNKDGSVYQTDIWMSGMAIVDFTNPAASRWYCDRLGEVIDMGVDAVKTDFGERIPTDVVYFDGSDPRKMHNYYPYLYNQAIFGLLEERRGRGEACVFARSATVGTQKFPVNWGGDNKSSYISMAESLRGGLSFCQSGFGFWAHDMSGFTATATPDLYKRWAAFGMLSTHSRLHGMETFRMPWCFDEESCRVLSFFTKLKCSLMPYIYEGAANVHRTGQPEMRAMMLDFPDDPTCAHLDRQYMLGERLLVAPVFRADGDVSFYVPAGRWTDYLTGEALEGGKWHARRCDYFHLPLLVRPGSVIAKGARDDSAVYDYEDGATYRIYELAEGETASCAVYGPDASERVRFTATCENGEIVARVSGSGADKPWKVLLAGVAASASDAALEVTGAGTLLTPAAGARSLRARL
jgi:alpha-D-xyloside xylohydrolase